MSRIKNFSALFLQMVVWALMEKIPGNDEWNEREFNLGNLVWGLDHEECEGY